MDLLLISLAEMHTLRIVRTLYLVKNARSMFPIVGSKKAESLFNERKKLDEETALTDYLQLCDKTDILRKGGDVLVHLGFKSKAKAESYFDEVEQLRNSLAHAQDIITNGWPKLADLAIDLENFLRACESHRCSPRVRAADSV